MDLPPEVFTALSRLESAGYEAYVVGGCVRDALMGTTPDDYDICTSATPSEVEVVFSDCRVIKTGIQHGTVTVVTEHFHLEITVFRTDSAYSDGRHPDSVSFSRSLEEDLSRRDFTINAMAYSPDRGLVDLYCGRKDLENRIIRCVGSPDVRFYEDSLRILRALRFGSVLDFDIEPRTADAAVYLAPRLSVISKERVAVELKKMITGNGFPSMLLNYPAIFAEILPELSGCIGYDQHNPHHEFDLLTHLAKTVSFLPKDPVLRLAGLLHDIGKPLTQSVDENGIYHYFGHAAMSEKMAYNALKRLKLSNREIERITALIHYHDGVIEETKRAVKRRIHQLGAESFLDLLSLQRADHAAQTSNPLQRKEHTDLLFQIAREAMSESECMEANQLAVNGHDMRSLGLEGRKIGEMLKDLLMAVIDGEVENQRDSLLVFAKQRMKSK